MDTTATNFIDPHPKNRKRVIPLAVVVISLIVAVAILWSNAYDIQTGGIDTLALLAFFCAGSLVGIVITLVRERLSLAILLSAIAAGTVGLVVINAPLRLRFAAAREAFDAEATKLSVNSTSSVHEQPSIGGFTIRAIFNDAQGVWFRTFNHPDGAWGFFKSASGNPPVPDEIGEQVGSTSLGGGWYLYRIRWD